jgi:hypothetical protein
MRRHTVDSFSTLKVGFLHKVVWKHLERGGRATECKETVRHRLVGRVFAGNPLVEVFSVPYQADHLVVGDLASDGDPSTTHRQLVTPCFSDELLWAGFGWEGVVGPQTIAFARRGSDLFLRSSGRLLIAIPVGVDPSPVAVCIDVVPVPVNSDAPCIPMANPRHPDTACVLRFDEAISVESRHSYFDSEVATAIVKEVTS